MNVLLKKILLLSLIGFIFNGNISMATDCTKTNDCTSMGFTKSENQCSTTDSIVRCPLDKSKVICISKDIGDLAIPCNKVGYILYGDGKCYMSAYIPAGIKPIGIIFDTSNRLALALSDVKQDGSYGAERMKWSSASCLTPNLETCKIDSPVSTTCAVDGRINTNAILDSTCNGTTYGANAANNYQPINCVEGFCQKGKWFLPSIRDLNNISKNRSEINKVLETLSSYGSSLILEEMYLSSNEGAENYVWRFWMSNNGGDYNDWDKKSFSGYVRPVVKY